MDEETGSLNSNMIGIMVPEKHENIIGAKADVEGENVGPNGGIIIVAPKRRRTENANAGPIYDVVMSFNSDGLQKNGYGAGTGLQARQQL